MGESAGTILKWPAETSIREMGLSQRVVNQLLANGITKAGDAHLASDARLLRFENFGRKCLLELRQVLAHGPDYELGTSLKALQFEVQRLRGENDALWRMIEMSRIGVKP